MKSRAHQIRDAARRWLTIAAINVQPDQLPFVLKQCAAHLVAGLHVDPVHADDIALSCWSEIEGAKSKCYIDLELSTPFMVFVVDPVSRTRHAFPVVDLVKMLGPRLAA